MYSRDPKAAVRQYGRLSQRQLGFFSYLTIGGEASILSNCRVESSRNTSTGDSPMAGATMHHYRL